MHDHRLDLFSPEILLQENYVVLDFETDTSHGDYGHPAHKDNGLLLACWKRQGGKVHAHWGNEFNQEELLHDIANAAFLVAHNAKYELGWLQRMGADVGALVVFDTKIAECVLLGNLHAEAYGAVSTSLDDCYQRIGGKAKDPVVDILITNGVNPVRIPRPWLQGRCEQDVRSTEELFLYQRARLLEREQLAVAWTRFITTPVLANGEFKGMQLDPSRVEEEYASYCAKLTQLEQEFDTLTGGINWKSSKQVAEYLYDTLGFEELTQRDGTPRRTRTLKRLTDVKSLAKLKAKTPEQKRFIELKKEIGQIGHALSKSLEFFIGVCREHGGTFLGEFHQHKTATHRLSSSGVPLKFEMFDKKKTAQFQNLPRKFKRLFRARKEGWKIMEWDGRQLEFRVAVHLGQDEQGRDDILGGHDVHRFSGACLFLAPDAWLKDTYRHMGEIAGLMPQITKEQRQDSKEHTFKPLYGGKSGTKREKAYYAAFAARYKGLAQEQQSWVYDVCQHPQNELCTEWGMRFYFPGARMEGDGYCKYTPSIYNYPVQCFATAEIIPVAMRLFWQRIRDLDLEEYIVLVNTVHDSVICEVHPDYIDVAMEIARDIWPDVYEYLRQVYGVTFYVPLGTEIQVGNYWSEPEVKRAYNIFPDGEIQEIAA